MTQKHSFLTLIVCLVSMSSYASINSPHSQFSISSDRVEVNNLVTFINASTNGTCNDVSSWKWDFGEGAYPEKSDSPGPHVVKYSTPGFKKIKLTTKGTTACSEAVVIKSVEVIKAPISKTSKWSMFSLGLVVSCIAAVQLWLKSFRVLA